MMLANTYSFTATDGNNRRERLMVFLKISCLLLALAGVSMLMASQAMAATFTVDNTSDTTGNCSAAGQCTLRTAVQLSNTVTGPNTININPGTYELSSGQLNITKDVTISGTNGDPATTVIDGRNLSRVFAVFPDGGTLLSPNVTFQGVTIQNGKASPDSYGNGGGGVSAELTAGKTLTLSNSILKNNMAKNGAGAGYGGGLNVTGPATAKAVIQNTSFLSNTAGERGGGLYLEGDLNIQINQATVTGNTSSAELGGGMAILAASYNSQGTVAITNSTFSQNTASGSSDDGIGGGLYLNAVAAISDTSFTNNTANSDGGGMYLTYFYYDKEASLTNVTFTGNTSTAGNGTGLLIQNGNPDLSNTKFENNTGLTASKQLDGNTMPITPLTPASPMKTSDNNNYAGGVWTAKDVTIATDASIDGGLTWNKGPIQVATDGNYAAWLKLKDSLGNAVIQQTQVMLDKTKPSVSVSLTTNGQPYTDGTWAKGDVSVGVTAADGTSGLKSKEYSLNGGSTWTALADNTPIVLSTNGVFALQIKVVDNAGNVEQQDFTIKIDKTPPALSVNMTSNGAAYVSGSWTNQPVTLQVSASDSETGLAALQYSLNNQPLTDYTVPVVLSADGTYQVNVEATDQSGNKSQVEATIQIDTVKPDLSLKLTTGTGDYTDGTWSRQSVTVKASITQDTGSGISSYQYSLDGGANWTAYTGDISLATDGQYAVLVKAADSAGNLSQETASVKVDQTAPNLGAAIKTSSGASYVNDTWSKENVTLELQPGDAMSGIASVEYSLDDGGAWTNYSQPVTVTNGVYSMKARATDLAGLVTEASWSVKIDSIAPSQTVTLTDGGGHAYTSDTWVNQPVTISLEANDENSSKAPLKPDQQYSLDGGTTWNPYSAAVTVTEGVYSVKVQAADAAGNATGSSFILKVDQTAPSLTVTMTAGGQPYNGGTWTAQDVTIQAAAADSLSGLSLLQYKLADGMNWNDYTGAITVTTEGAHAVQFQALDLVGNTASAKVDINISKSVPTIVLGLVPNTVTNGDVSVRITPTVSGDQLGNTVTRVKYAPGDEQASFFSSGGGQDIPLNLMKFDVHDNGAYTVYVQDAAGNEAVQKVDITQIVRDVPLLQLTFSPGGLTNGDVTVSITATVYGTLQGNMLSQQKWADGTRDTAYFAAAGTDVGAGSKFTVSANGMYTVFVKDIAGNEAVGTIDIQTISLTKPSIVLSAAPVGPTNEQVTITVASTVYGSPNGIDTIRWAPGHLDNSYFEGGNGTGLGSSSSVSFTVTENGEYSVYVKDTAGNAATQRINVTEVNHAPVISDHTVSGTKDTVLTFRAEDFPFTDVDGDAIVKIKLNKLPDIGKLYLHNNEITVLQDVYLADLSYLTFSPAAGWFGETAFEWYGFDGKSYAKATATMKISIGQGNLPPSAAKVQLTTAVNTAVQGKLLGQDPESEDLTYSLEPQGKLGAFTLINSSTGTFEFKPYPDVTGTETVTYSVYDKHMNAASGIVEVTITPRGASSQAELTSLSLSAGPLVPAFNPQVLSYNVSVANAVYATTVTAAVYEPHAKLFINDLALASGQESNPVMLQEGFNTIVVKAVAEDGKSTASYTITIYREPTRTSRPNKGSGSSGQVPAPDPATNLTGRLNGKPVEDLGSIVTEQVNGQTVTTATLDRDKVKEQMEHSGSKPTVTVTIPGNVDRAILNMDAGTVSMLQNSQATVQLQSNLGGYTLPLGALSWDTIAAQLGAQANAADIRLSITISKASNELVARAQQQAKYGQYAILMPPVNFTVTAIYKDRTTEIHLFSGLVSRALPISADVNTNRITTAVVILEDGTVYHVPTRIVNQAGQFFAEISSLTNSTYAIISNSKTFEDMTGHWAQREVNEMASRMIVQGVAAGKYSPDTQVTRAEFAAIVIRALGLSDRGQTAGTYHDVPASEWYAGAVAQASAFGLVSGYEDGTFRPNRTITREEALVIIARASRLAGRVVSLNTADPKSILSEFRDQGEVDDWALQEAAQAVQSGLIQGSGDGLKPKSEITRAETAVTLYRLLVQSKLIDG
ncbi:OmpL47-type beta-barrel domain-containing protein [Paenibacillus rigui]|uniref:SLH domain-containing protein n=1 Tax=Paenibacillus rigui TaxID=554312 RepID=A0A229UQH2_9BACL|nr:S-layer homology domain-containing protein [Paenibacillus rigui]OXM85706.1 hypothetical protein CF651_14120 [Paenibacillus rigui]